MTSKTERLELRLSSDFINKIDNWRTNTGETLSRSEAVRRLIEEGLNVNPKQDFQPTKSERLIISMLAKIRKDQIMGRKNNKDNDYDLKDIRLIEQAISGGHYWALDSEMNGIMHNHIDDPKRVNFVIDVMDMWSFIEEAHRGFDQSEVQRLIDEVGTWAKTPKFIGFDGNNEGEYRNIANFLVLEMDRFDEFKGRSMNSHTRTVEGYTKMLATFKTIRPKLIGRELYIDEVIAILKSELIYTARTALIV